MISLGTSGATVRSLNWSSLYRQARWNREIRQVDVDAKLDKNLKRRRGITAARKRRWSAIAAGEGAV